MITRRIELRGACDWWTSGARSARFFAPSGEELDTAVLLGPEVEDDGFERARERARPWIGNRRPGLLTLLAVERVSGRVGFVYQPFDGVSLGAVMRTLAAPLSQRLAAEIVAQCAEIAEQLWLDGAIHPGLDLDDVLLRADGTVRFANLVGPFARAPVHRDPRGAEDSATAVWRLGVLLAHLLTGAPPSTATDRVSHELMLRRLLIRIMSRPGQIFPERYRDWQCAMLAWSPEDRPMLSRIAPGLREIASLMQDVDLASWARQWVPEIRRQPRSSEAPPPVADNIELSEVQLSPVSEKTEEAPLPDLPPHDDTTAVSIDGDPPRPFAPTEHGAVPVHVGPPPEALPKTVALPEELFGTPLLPTDPDTPATQRGRRERTEEIELGRWRRAIGIGVALAIIAVLLSWYILE